MELFVETHVWSQNCQKGAQQFVDNHAQHLCGMFVQPFYFVSYYFY
jgi:hypothetical protein